MFQPSSNACPENLPLGARQIWILIVSSMEQIIGAGISTIAGIIIPMIALTHGGRDLSTLMQGVVGASGLIGIAVGSLFIGRLSDRDGYLIWFRVSPLMIIVGSAITLLWPTVAGLVVGLFISGVGIGGGYSLDSAYISELMPAKWRLVMVGIAKASCAIGFIGVAAVCYVILRHDPNPAIWSKLIYIMLFFGVITLAMRVAWHESPHWLLLHSRPEQAQEAVTFFFGKGVKPDPVTASKPTTPAAQASWADMFRGDNLCKVILTGIPWACEGLGVYGFGVFLPILIMHLGLEPHYADGGVAGVTQSLLTTTIVNFFILPGFIIGLLIMNRRSHVGMLTNGFLACSLGLVILLVAWLLKLPAWVSIIGFIVFEVFLNAGPHLITFVLPAEVFPVETRAAGNGVAAMLGKVGAVLGVMLMPLLLKLGGMTLLLAVSVAVMLLGALIAAVYGRELKSKELSQLRQ